MAKIFGHQPPPRMRWRASSSASGGVSFCQLRTWRRIGCRPVWANRGLMHRSKKRPSISSCRAAKWKWHIGAE
jgi:hypothetical protein